MSKNKEEKSDGGVNPIYYYIRQNIQIQKDSKNKKGISKKYIPTIR